MKKIIAGVLTITIVILIVFLVFEIADNVSYYVIEKRVNSSCIELGFDGGQYNSSREHAVCFIVVCEIERFSGPCVPQAAQHGVQPTGGAAPLKEDDPKK